MNPQLTTTEFHLPSPTENPAGEVLIYDGKCKFCTASVKRLAKWDRRRRLSFLSLHDPQVATRFPQWTYDQLMQEMHLIDRRGKCHRGAEAFRYLTTRIPRLYALAPLVHIPFSLPFWHWAYRQVARRRYLILGRTDQACDSDTCKVHFK
jgi:predicted DCC family thiol-disulfide oxidoreductase YuxK